MQVMFGLTKVLSLALFFFLIFVFYSTANTFAFNGINIFIFILNFLISHLLLMELIM